MEENAFIDNRLANFSHLIFRVKERSDQIKYVNRWCKLYAWKKPI